jgi:tetratricopeptide (TPR) repeat protein
VRGARADPPCFAALAVMIMGLMRQRAMWQSVVALGSCFPLCLSSRAADCGSAAYDCAVFYIQRGNFPAAVESLQTELQQSPHDLKAINLLGIALTGSGQRKEANRRFQDALALDPHFYPARKNWAINEFDEKRFAEAEAQFNQVLKEAPGDPIVHLYLGEISFERKDCSAALKHYENGGNRMTQKSLWVMHDAQCQLTQNDSAKAIAVLNLLPENDVDDRFQAGLLLGRAGAYARAAEFFALVRKRYSDPYVAGYNQLLMLTKAASYSQAILLFHELVAEGYGRAELYNLASESYVKTGRLQDAYDTLRTATRLEPTIEDNYIDLGMLCLEYENYDLGSEILDVGIHYIPHSYRFYVQRGVMLVMRGHMEEAEREFQIASTLAPEKTLSYVALSEVWMQSGRTQKAVELLREKTKVAGNDFIVPYIFALALIRSGADAGSPQGAEARHALEVSIRLKSNFPRSHAELGQLFLKAGEVDRGIAELKIATDLDPTDSGPLYQLGQAYRRKGQKAEAEALLARVAQLHSPEHDSDLKQELKRLVKLDTLGSETLTKP